MIRNGKNKLLEDCLRIRLVEEKIITLYPTDLIQSPVHLSIGQEAAAVGLCSVLKRMIRFSLIIEGMLCILPGGRSKRIFL